MNCHHWNKQLVKLKPENVNPQKNWPRFMETKTFIHSGPRVFGNENRADKRNETQTSKIL